MTLLGGHCCRSFFDQRFLGSSTIATRLLTIAWSTFATKLTAAPSVAKTENRFALIYPISRAQTRDTRELVRRVKHIKARLFRNPTSTLSSPLCHSHACDDVRSKTTDSFFCSVAASRQEMHICCSSPLRLKWAQSCSKPSALCFSNSYENYETSESSPPSH